MWFFKIGKSHVRLLILKKAQKKIINDVGLSLVALIDNAQPSIDIAAYGFDGQDEIINALRRAKKRGVRIRGVVDDYGATLYKRTNSVIKEFGGEHLEKVELYSSFGFWKNIQLHTFCWFINGLLYDSLWSTLQQRHEYSTLLS